MKMNARARHETVNRRFKQLDCLKCFRHDKQLHVHCLNAVAVITQLAIENGEPLYHVKYKIVY
jgi:predicted hydrolase (HD superfamily)